MEPQMYLENQSNPEQKNDQGRMTIPDLMIHYRTTVIKTIWYGMGTKENKENRHIDPQNRIEDPNISSLKYNHLILYRDTKNHNLEKRLCLQ